MGRTKMRRKGWVVFKVRRAKVLMAALLCLGVQVGFGPAVGMWAAEGKAAGSSANVKKVTAMGRTDGALGGQADLARAFRGKRDPFRTPPPPAPGKTEQRLGPLPPGKRGLVIGQLKLEGIVCGQTGKGMIAVVANRSNRAYFLRLHDQVYNGVVGEITPDSIHFRRNRLDANGRLDTEDVVLRLDARSREER